MPPTKTFRQYVEQMDGNLPDDMTNMPDGKQRNGLADPDPGDLKKPHKPNSQDVDLAKQATQLMMLRSSKWHRKLYKFLRRVGDKIPDIGHLVDQMTKPKDVGPAFGDKDKQPDVLSPNSADSSPAYYQK
jgi:hypothetical protein